MKQEIITQLVKELFSQVEELHQEYEDNNISYVIDAQKEDNTLNITISLNEKTDDKKDFEQWVDDIPDDIFEEAIESLKEEITDFDEIYDSEEYHDIIDAFKEKVNEIAQNKINDLKVLLQS